jgi:hypothetical protein
MPTMTLQRRKNIQKSVTQIVQLHEELLAELHKVVPNSETDQDEAMPRPQKRKPTHMRWHSAESAPLRPNLKAISHRLRHSIDASRPAILQVGGVIVNTSIVLNVARIFDRFVSWRIFNTTLSLTVSTDDEVPCLRSLRCEQRGHGGRRFIYLEIDTYLACI